MDLLQTLLVYMSLVFATSVQTAPEPSTIPETTDYAPVYVEVTPVPTAVATPVPTINITPNPSYKTLQTGDKGAKVRELQSRLLEYGYYEGEIDGAYGNQTRQAVERFQYMHGLTVDGIAGRHTLTVLYESDEVRLPQNGIATAPTAATTLAVAVTPTPSPEPMTTLPSVLVATATPAAEPTAAPVQQPTEAMDGYTVWVGEEQTELKAFAQGENVYLPVLAILRASGVNVISSQSVELDEYAFASGMDLIRFTHTANQQNQPVDLQVYRNDEPQLVPVRTLHSEDNVLYMAASSFEKMTGMICTVDHEQKKIEVMVNID